MVLGTIVLVLYYYLVSSKSASNTIPIVRLIQNILLNQPPAGRHHEIDKPTQTQSVRRWIRIHSTTTVFHWRTCSFLEPPETITCFFAGAAPLQELKKKKPSFSSYVETYRDLSKNYFFAVAEAIVQRPRRISCTNYLCTQNSVNESFLVAEG